MYGYDLGRIGPECLFDKERVERLALFDIVPTLTLFETVNRQFATAWSASGDVFTEEAMALYRRSFRDPATIHATCEDYRAGAGIDLEHDRAAGRRIACPLLVLWGQRGLIGRSYNVLATWQEKADRPVAGAALDCGHFLSEEKPEQTLAALLGFLGPAA